jgi:hypothetical protein
VCRKSGLEIKRRCGWLNTPVESNGPLVWVRKQVALRTCPKSYISSDSLALVEEFLVRRKLGGMDFERLSARQVEAFVILERALDSEVGSRG